jgi:hypothetical protein
MEKWKRKERLEKQNPHENNYANYLNKIEVQCVCYKNQVFKAKFECFFKNEIK